MEHKKSNFKRKPAPSGRPPRKWSGKKKAKPLTGIPIEKFVQAAKDPVKVKKDEVETRPFLELDLHPKLSLNVLNKGYLQTTPIQDQAIEPILEGHDILGIAQTGTGKTAAFLIPLMQRWLLDEHAAPALVLVPTRELAQQVELEFRSINKGLKLFSNSFIGGSNIHLDFRKLQRYHHLIVGTPGRLLDLVKRRALNLEKFETLILDEFDRMLDMGFTEDVNLLADAMKNRKQTLLFSATVDPTIQKQVDALLKEPLTIKVSTGEKSADHIEQEVVKVPRGEDKFSVLEKLIYAQEMDKVLIFAETRFAVDRLTTQLLRAGFKADLIHGEKSQGQRQKALESFRAGRVQILVATDVAARGLDIDNVTHVINFETPRTYDSYIHRIGRTGRAGKTGKAYTFVDVKSNNS
jgi:ATP-dependent RNA helicase RhlE